MSRIFRLGSLSCRSPGLSRMSSTAAPPRLFDYDTIKKNLVPSRAIIHAVEDAFGKLAQGLVDVPIPMHIGIHETAVCMVSLSFIHFSKWLYRLLALETVTSRAATSKEQLHGP